MLQVEAPNIFIPRNDWNIQSMNCKKGANHDEFVTEVAIIIRKELGVNPFTELKCQKGTYVMARQLLITMVYNYTRRTLMNIGNIVAKDHATVLYAIEVVHNLYDTDKRFKAMYDRIDDKVKKLK